MRVLVVFSSSGLGGAERSLSRMAFLSSDVEYTLASIQGEGPWSEWVRSHGFSPVMFGNENSGNQHFGLFSALIKLIKYLRKTPFDVVYVCGLRLSLGVRLFRFFFRKTKVVHGVRWNPDSNRTLDRFFRMVENISAFSVDAWITNSKVAKDTLVQRCTISSDQVHVIYNGINKLNTDVLDFLARPLEVLTVANLAPRKGYIEYLKEIKKVIAHVPDARFIFIGSDQMNGELQRVIEDEGLSRSICYEGFQQDITPWLNRARVFVLPSLLGEGCPTTILEAFSFGVPVVAYRIDGVPELVKEGVDGYLSPVGEGALAEHIVKLLLEPSCAEEMGQKGRKKVDTHFLIEACRKAHDDIFKKIVN